MIKTPIFDFVSEYIDRNPARFHMPGHKGCNTPLEIEARDITEIEGADYLFSDTSTGIISQSEEICSQLFGTAKTVYSTSGSTLCIQTMLRLATQGCSERPNIIAGRNAHKAFVNACILLDIDVRWLLGDEKLSLCSAVITPSQLEKAIVQSDVKPCAVYVTSPDYLGIVSDIKGLSEVCKRHGILLLVDNAHGAYLKFLPKSIHPIDCGADMCCDSAHKTLPVLTGGAYLHISKDAPSYFCDCVKREMSLFASTSPSYLIMQSLDLCNAYLGESFSAELACCIERTNQCKEQLINSGIALVNSEPLKITIDAHRFGYSGTDFAELLLRNNVICEYSDARFVVLMISPKNSESDFAVLECIASEITQKPEIFDDCTTLSIPKKAMSIRQAALSPSESISVDKAVGRICSGIATSCQPSIPVAVSGEVIDEDIINILKKYSISRVNVVK